MRGPDVEARMRTQPTAPRQDRGTLDRPGLRSRGRMSEAQADLVRAPPPVEAAACWIFAGHRRRATRTVSVTTTTLRVSE